MDAVCNFQSMKSPVELNSLSSKFFCYITWLDATLDDLQTRPLRQILLFFRNNSLAVKKNSENYMIKQFYPGAENSSSLLQSGMKFHPGQTG